MARRAMPASDWQRVRKDAAGETDVSKAITSETVAESGKAPPGNIAGREFPGQRVKVPPIDDTADTSETISLPRKVDDKAKCNCDTIKDGAEKCNCNTIKDEEKSLKERAASMFGMEVDKDGNLKDKPILKPLPTPSGGQTEEDFISSCMRTLNGEYPDEKQRAAICYGQWKEKAQKSDGEAAPTEVTKVTNAEQQAAQEQTRGPGVMLALVAPDHLAKKLARPGGEPPEDMHVTLGYYGRVGEHLTKEQVDAIHKCVVKQAEGYKPVKAVVGGVGRFNASGTSDGKDVLVGLVDSPDLHDIRDHLIEEVAKCSGITKAEDQSEITGARPKRDHGYTPHITLAYIDQDAEMPIHKLDRDEFTFTHLVMAVGKERKLFKLGEKPNVSKSIWMPIVKADDDMRLATGIVLQPEVVDAQGDIISAQVIRQAAHNFLALYNKKTQLGLQHELMKPDGVELVESWITPVDMVLNNRVIKAGTWMMTVRVKNDALWTKIKTGQLGGFSIGGVARVQKLAA